MAMPRWPLAESEEALAWAIRLPSGVNNSIDAMSSPAANTVPFAAHTFRPLTAGAVTPTLLSILNAGEMCCTISFPALSVRVKRKSYHNQINEVFLLFNLHRRCTTKPEFTTTVVVTHIRSSLSPLKIRIKQD